MNAKNAILVGLGGAVVGGVLGLLLAPQSGRHTRALVRDKSVKYTHGVADFAGKKSRHIANKARGYAHDVRGLVGRKASEAREEVASV